MDWSEDRFAQSLVKDICNYLDDLRGREQLQVTIHLAERYVLPCWMHLLPYNQHESVYCLCLKNSSPAWEHCIDCQKKVLEKAKDGAYVGVCWAGMLEAIFPLRKKSGECVAFLSVSGYQAPRDKALPRIARASREYMVNYENLMAAYEMMKPVTPDLGELSRRIAPLQQMMTLLFEHYGELQDEHVLNGSSQRQYQLVMAHLKRRFAEKVTIQSVADLFHCSYSYISHLFSQFGEDSFSHVLTKIRVDAAKKYLEYTSQSIMEIGFAVGFDDPNYFTSVFKKETGMSPTIWRKTIHEKNKNKGEEQP